MKPKKRRYYFFPLFIIGVILLLSAAVMLLWNGILTDVLNVKPISYGQAIGLFILSKLLFGFPRPGPPGGFRHGGPPWRRKLMDMSEEEKEIFKKEWEKRNTGRNDPPGRPVE